MRKARVDVLARQVWSQHYFKIFFDCMRYFLVDLFSLESDLKVIFENPLT